MLFCILSVAAATCERIKTTPMPQGYVAALRGFLLMFLVSLPFTMIGTYHGFAIIGEALIAFIFLDLVSCSLLIIICGTPLSAATLVRTRACGRVGAHGGGNRAAVR